MVQTPTPAQVSGGTDLGWTFSKLGRSRLVNVSEAAYQ